MALQATFPGERDVRSAAYLDRFDAYRLAVEFQQCLPRLLPRTGSGELRQQLERASLSVVLNLAEGLGRCSRADKAHFYAIARGSALESEAAIDVLFARHLIGADTHRTTFAQLDRLAQMLTKLILRMQS